MLFLCPIWGDRWGAPPLSPQLCPQSETTFPGAAAGSGQAEDDIPALGTSGAASSVPAAVGGAVGLLGWGCCILVQKQLKSNPASRECCAQYGTLAGEPAPQKPFPSPLPLSALIALSKPVLQLAGTAPAGLCCAGCPVLGQHPHPKCAGTQHPSPRCLPHGTWSLCVPRRGDKGGPKQAQQQPVSQLHITSFPGVQLRPSLQQWHMQQRAQQGWDIDFPAPAQVS